MKAGYTLIELMVVITITALLVSLGISSYTKAQKSQSLKAASESILTVLTENQKLASSGNKDCPGAYLGQQVVFTSGTPQVDSRSLCEGGQGTPTTVSVQGITFTAGHTLVFMPLNQGVDLGGASTVLIDYTDNVTTYRIEVLSSGSIRNVGKL